MAIIIRTTPTIEDFVEAEWFINKAEENYINKGTIDFSGQGDIMNKILDKAKIIK
jgi:hypothetical protein